MKKDKAKKVTWRCYECGMVMLSEDMKKSEYTCPNCGSKIVHVMLIDILRCPVSVINMDQMS